MTRCKRCGADSPDIRWKETEEGKFILWNYNTNTQHQCQKKVEKEIKMIVCPLCNPLDDSKHMTVQQYETHKYSHIEFHGSRAD